MLLPLAACQALSTRPGEKCLVYFVSKAVFVYLQLFSNIYVDVNDYFVCWQTPLQPNIRTGLSAAGSCARQCVLPLLGPLAAVICKRARSSTEA